MFHSKNFGKVVSIWFVISLLASCSPVTPLPVTMPSPVKTTAPSQTPTPAGPTVKFEKPTLWNVYDPKDPGLPELIVPGAHGLQLDPQWKVAKIEYVYRKWTADEGGLASRSGLGHEIIEQSSISYRWNNKTISSEKINALLSAITNLHPAQSLLVGVFHTDDYPTWKLELTGTDGSQILLYSASDENPGYGPWNVIYNGRIYAQYEGTIGPLIGKLFDGTGDSFIWQADNPDYHPSDVVGFATSGLPNQLAYGFTGLLLISGHFDYAIDFTQNEILGYIRNPDALGSTQDPIVGDINALNSVELTVDGKEHACIINRAEWTFSCKPGSIAPGQKYRYPIRIELNTDAGRKIVTAGELDGVWQEQAPTVLLPPGQEVQAAIEGNPDLQDLLKDHVFSLAAYTGKMQLEKDKSPVLLGEMILDGQASVAGYTFPYTVTVPFGIIDQKFAEWGLTRQKLQQFISDVFKSALTLRIYKDFPHTTLNLWYITHDKLDNFPAMPDFVGPSLPSYFGIRVPKCDGNPAVIFPDDQHPLRAFGFNAPVDFSEATTFVLTDTDAIPYNVYFYLDGEKDQLTSYFVPKELSRAGEIPFSQIQYEHLEKGSATLELQPDPKAKDLANSITASLSIAIDKKYGYYWDLRNVGVVINKDGSLSLVACPAQ